MRSFRRFLSITVVATCAVAVALTLGESTAVGGETAPTPQQVRARAKTSAWIVTWDRTRVLASLRANAGKVGRISPYWFRLRHDGDRIVNRTGAMDRDVLAVARTHDLPVVPTITNDFDPARVTAMLRTEASRDRHVTQVVNLVTRAGTPFTGVDIDYENLATADRANFTAFVRDLARALHARDRTLSVSVPAATSATDGLPGFLAYDYEAIGRAADEVRVLAYDFNEHCGGAGPIAPIDWVEDVVEYLKGEVPRQRLVLGAPLYGYDWPPTGCATSRTWRDTMGLRRRHSGVLAWSRPWQSRRMRYEVNDVRRIVWFEDAASTAAKARLVETHRLKGMALWRIGGEDPATWTQLERILGQPRP